MWGLLASVATRVQSPVFAGNATLSNNHHWLRASYNRRRRYIGSAVASGHQRSSIYNRKSYGLKVEAQLKNREEYVSNKLSKRFDEVEKETQLSNSCKFQSIQIWSQRNEAYSKINFKINPFEVKSVLECNYKLFRNTAIRKNFNPKSDPQMKTHSNKWRN